MAALNTCLASYSTGRFFNMCCVLRFLMAWDRIIKGWCGPCYYSLASKQEFEALAYMKQDPVQEQVF